MNSSSQTNLGAFRRYLYSGNRSVELDFVRGIAILLVVGFHALAPSTPYPAWQALDLVRKAVGWSGVDLFFVLSGFLVGGVLLSEYGKTGALDVKRFIIRRGLKIWPAYYFYLFFQVIVRRHPMQSFLVANLLHIQNYAGSSLEHTWTLSIEEHFYLLLSFFLGGVALRKSSIRRVMLVFAAVLGLVLALRCGTWFAGFHMLAQRATHTRIDSLLFGVILAALLEFYPGHFDWIIRRPGVLLAVFFSAMAFIAFAYAKPAVLYTIGYTWIYLGYGALMLFLYGHSGALRDAIAYRVIAKIGVYSYGIYLWHLAVRDTCFNLASHLSPGLRWPFAMASEYLTAIVLGTILTHLIEWPALRVRDRLFPAKGRLHSLIVPSPASSVPEAIAVAPKSVSLTAEPSA